MCRKHTEGHRVLICDRLVTAQGTSHKHQLGLFRGSGSAEILVPRLWWEWRKALKQRKSEYGVFAFLQYFAMLVFTVHLTVAIPVCRCCTVTCHGTHMSPQSSSVALICNFSGDTIIVRERFSRLCWKRCGSTHIRLQWGVTVM